MGDVFECAVTVRWTDFDAIGHVNNALYLTYVEEGRDAFLRPVFDEIDPMYVVRKLEIEYLAEIRRTVRALRVQVEPVQAGNTSFVTRERVLLPNGTVAATCLTTCIRWDDAAGAKLPLTEGQRRLLA